VFFGGTSRSIQEKQAPENLSTATLPHTSRKFLTEVNKRNEGLNGKDLHGLLRKISCSPHLSDFCHPSRVGDFFINPVVASKAGDAPAIVCHSCGVATGSPPRSKGQCLVF
jgi:hypothetical protein